MAAIRWFPVCVLLCVLSTASLVCATDCSRRQVFIDTDIGSDFDDSTAIVYAIKNFKYEVQFVLMATGDVVARAKVAAKYLELAGLDHVPIGIGMPNQKSSGKGALFDWAEDYNISQYKGGVYQNGVDEMAKRILQSPCKEVFILEIAPAPNMMEMLEKYPDVVKKAQVKAMAGSIRVGYDNSSTPSSEYNVAMCPQCMRAMFQSGMNITITPLDSCQFFKLVPSQEQALLIHPYPVPSALMKTFLYWCTVHDCRLNVASDPWYDSVAAFLVEEHPEELLQIEVLKISVTDQGYTVVDDKSGTLMYVATGWRPDEGGPVQLGNIYVDTVNVPT